MVTLINEEKNVYKFVHEDGSETAIKYVGCTTCHDNHIDETLKERNKYSIFISSSVGCMYNCKFCYLSTKQIKYKKLSIQNIIDNLKEAIDYFINENEELKKYYVKICWMGMGENGLIVKNLMKMVTIDILKYILEEKKYAIGLDGLDIATICSNHKNLKFAFEDLIYLNTYLTKYPLNPNNTISENNDNKIFNKYENRSIVRIFYSLHSAINEVRNYLIPNTKPIEESLSLLQNLNNNHNINIILHQFFIDGINDKEKDINALIKLIEQVNQDFLYFELRILRLNACDKLTFTESKNFENIILQLKDKTNIFKVQVSPGSEVKAACGQFLMAYNKKI